MIVELISIHAYRLLIDKTAAKITGDGDYEACQQGHRQAPGQYISIHLAPTQHPVEGSQRQQHDCQNGVTPCGDQVANTAYQYQIGEPDNAGNPTTTNTHDSKPEPGACPKEIGCNEISQIRCNHTQQGSHRKMDQHGMNRMTEDGHFTDDGFAAHKCTLTGLLSLGLPFLLTACNGPYSTLDPAGPTAHSIALLWWGMFAFATVVLLAVVLLWLYAMHRDPGNPDPAQVAAIQKRLIIGGGLVLPTASILLLLIIGVPMGQRMHPQPSIAGQDTAYIEVTGHQWWWEVSYPGTGVTLQNTLHIPAGTAVNIHLRSSDVIHSFWVPRLAGKLDAIPGVTNILRLQVDEPGTYYGQCAEFCGLQHAHMLFTVEAHTQEDFDTWLSERRNDAPP
jgi:cytochrome c oxidase subunit II